MRKLSTVLSMVWVDGSWRFGEESRSTVSLLPRLVALAWPTFCPLVRLSLGSGGIVDRFAASRAAMGKFPGGVKKRTGSLSQYPINNNQHSSHGQPRASCARLA